MGDITATGAGCWNCGETDAHFEEQGVRVAVSCYECGVRGAWAPTGEEALSSWHDIAETMALAEKARQKTGMIGGGMYTIIDPGEKRVKAEPAPCGACGGTGGFSQGGMRIDCPICGGDGKSAKADAAREAAEARAIRDMKRGAEDLRAKADAVNASVEADHKIAEAARGCMETCVAAAPDVVRCPGCSCRKVCIAIREAQNSPQKSLDTGKGEG